MTSIQEKHVPWLYKYLTKNFNITDTQKDYIINKITNAIRGLDCVDNFRICNAISKEAMDEYNNIKDDGCCGFYDTIITLRSGERIKFGFNYGH